MWIVKCADCGFLCIFSIEIRNICQSRLNVFNFEPQEKNYKKTRAQTKNIHNKIKTMGCKCEQYTLHFLRKWCLCFSTEMKKHPRAVLGSYISFSWVGWNSRNIICAYSFKIFQQFYRCDLFLNVTMSYQIQSWKYSLILRIIWRILIIILDADHV